MTFEVRHGDCREVMATLADDSIDAIVSDPPYGLSFMGKGWDHGVPGVEFWTEALRVAKPGAHLLAFGGTRTYHRLACAIEDAGWEVRDCLMWVYGSGFPKSLDVSKSIDKRAGALREIVGTRPDAYGEYGDGGGWSKPSRGDVLLTGDPVTDSARAWSGWGTALKPAHEPIILARKPLAGTVAANVLTHGTGAINVDGCRIGSEGGTKREGKADAPNDSGWANMRGHGIATLDAGRWPANFIHDGSEEVTQLLGDAARFFYCPKASREDREAGLREAGLREASVKMNNGNDAAGDPVSDRFTKIARNSHPTVKPTDLMRYLCRLVTPPNGLVLDPFTGSGSTGKAALLEGFRFIGIEREAEYVEIARARCAAALQPKDLFNG